MKNIQLNLKRKREMHRLEFYKIIVIIILITRFEFKRRAHISKYIPAPNLGMTTGTSSPIFDELWSALR